MKNNPIPDKEVIYTRLEVALRQADELFQSIGPDIELLRAAGDSYRAMAVRLGYPKSTLEAYHKTWKEFPTPEALEVDGARGSFAHALMSTQVARRVKKNGGDVSAQEVFREAVRQGSSSRELRRKFEEQVQNMELNRLRALAAGTMPLVSSRCEQRDCVEVLESLPDGSIDLAWLDPPYWNYRSEDGGLPDESYRGTVLTRCANRSADESRAVVLRLISILPRKLKRTAVVSLWAHGMHSDDWQVIRALEEHGLLSASAGFWPKGALAPAGMTIPETTSCERYLLRAFNPKALRSWDHRVSRNNVIDLGNILTVSKRRALYHLMEKPEELAERFIRKYCPPNSLVFDAFGCSGSASIAAHRLGHRFVYCELHPKCFQYGSGRIAEALRRAGEGAA
jgi:hypothetical protein